MKFECSSAEKTVFREDIPKTMTSAVYNNLEDQNILQYCDVTLSIHDHLCLPWGPMNPEAGLGMWIPSEEGEGAGTKALERGEGTCSWGLPGEPTLSRVPGDGVPIRAVEGEGVTYKRK